MKKTLLSLFLAACICLSLLGGFALAEDAIAPSDFTTWVEESAAWHSAINANADAGTPAGFVADPAGAPTAEQLEEMLHFASLAVTSGGKQDFFFIAVTDPEEQLAIIGERASLTSEGTVTILVLSERILAAEFRTDEVAPFQPDRGYYDAGIASGYLNLAAISKGFATRFFMTPALPGDNGFNAGAPGLDIAKYIEGLEYELATTHEMHSIENMKFVCAIVIGTLDAELETSVTDKVYPDNYAIWEK